MRAVVLEQMASSLLAVKDDQVPKKNQKNIKHKKS
jgi:hypothetical protein